MKEVPFANALAVVSAGAYALCALLFLSAPQAILGLFQSWFHGIDLLSLGTRSVTLNGFIFGLISLVVVAWVFGYAWAWVYNKLAK